MYELKPYMRFNLDGVCENARRFHKVASKFWSRDQYDIFYALKANPDVRIVDALVNEEINFEAMTKGQLEMVRHRGGVVIVSGFHKPAALLRAAQSYAQYIVLEGAHEIDRVSKIEGPVGFLLRVQLDPSRKLGFHLEEIAGTSQYLHLRSGKEILGLHFHAGWNIKDQNQIMQCLELIAEARQKLLELNIEIRIVNFGGSFCEHKTDPDQLESRLRMYSELVRDWGVRVHFEPGRYLVGDAGELVSQISSVDYVKKRVHLNTCAYGYKLNAGSPRARLLANCSGQRADWTLFGFWSAEGDQCEIELVGQPKVGDLLVLENMGAYTWDMPLQFEPEEGPEVIFLKGH